MSDKITTFASPTHLLLSIEDGIRQCRNRFRKLFAIELALLSNRSINMPTSTIKGQGHTLSMSCQTFCVYFKHNLTKSFRKATWKKHLKIPLYRQHNLTKLTPSRIKTYGRRVPLYLNLKPCCPYESVCSVLAKLLENFIFYLNKRLFREETLPSL